MKRHSHFFPACAFLAAAMCIASAAHAADDLPASPDALLKALKAAPYASLKNIKAAGTVKQVDFDPATGKASVGNSLIFDEIIDTTGTGRFRMDLTPSTSPSQSDNPPYFSRYESYSFNGKFGVQAIYKEGSEGKIFDYPSATVTKTPDSLTGLYLRWALCGFITPLLKVDGEERSLIDTLTTPRTQLNENTWRILIPSVRPDTLDGKPLLCLEIKDNPDKPANIESLWLDPARGYLLVRRIWANGLKSPRIWQYDITGAKEVTKGIWLPTGGTFSISYSGKLEQTVKLEINSLEVNIPENGDTYTSAIQPDSHVEDQRYGVSFEGKDVPNIPAKLKDDETSKK